MSNPSADLPFDLESLFSLFRPVDEIPQYEVIQGEDMPEPYNGLLVHEYHMTVTMEAHYGDLVEVRILERVHDGDTYARKILLALEKTANVVQFGIVKVDLSFVNEEVREEIVEGVTPFGRILIKHNVMRRIEPFAYLKITPGESMMQWFGMDKPETVYGRLCYIHCNEKPAVQLLEVVAP